MFILFLALNLIPQTIAQLSRFNTRLCGMTQLPNDIQPLASSSARVVNGFLVHPSDVPWAVQVVDKRKEGDCTGSLLNRWWVITAAHCVRNLDPATNQYQWYQPDDLTVLAGGSRISSNVTGQLNMTFNGRFPFHLAVAKVIPHSRYTLKLPQHRFLEEVAGDVALLLLKEERPVVYDSVTRRFLVNYICLPSGPPALGQEHLFAGYGRLGEAGEENFMNQLLTFEKPVYGTLECADRWNNLLFEFISDNLNNDAITMPPGFTNPGLNQGPDYPEAICTIADSFINICLGDSGGPLAIQRPDGRWELTGVARGVYYAEFNTINPILNLYNNPATTIDQTFDLLDDYNHLYPCGHIATFNAVYEYREWIESVFETESPPGASLTGALSVGAVVSVAIVARLIYPTGNGQQHEEPDVEQGQEKQPVHLIGQVERHPKCWLPQHRPGYFGHYLIRDARLEDPKYPEEDVDYPLPQPGFHPNK